MQKISCVRKALALAIGTAAAVLTLATPAFAAPTTVSSVPQKMPTFDGGVYATVYLGSTIYVGGSFLNANWAGHKNARPGLAAINAVTGALLPWAPTADGKVLALAVDPAAQTVYAAGDFTTINGTARDGLAGMDATTGALTPFSHTVSGEPRTLAVGHGMLYAGGGFLQIDSAVRNRLAAFDLATGALSTTWAPSADDTVYSLLSDTARVYVGGKFRTIAGGSAPKLAAVTPDNGTLDTTFKPSVNVAVFDLALGPNSVIAAEGGLGGRAIAYSTTGANQWTITTDGDVAAVAYLNGVVYIGGHFDNACKSATTGAQGFCVDGSVPRVKLAAVDATNGVLTSWDPQANGIHGTFSISANPTLGTVAAGGEFTTIGGLARGRFAQFG